MSRGSRRPKAPRSRYLQAEALSEPYEIGLYSAAPPVGERTPFLQTT